MTALSSAQEELLFSRTLLLEDLDEAALSRLRQSRVLVIGAGGLGCPVALYLAAGGVGHLHWVDGDLVNLSNLPRQVLFGPADEGQPKVLVGAAALGRLAPQCQVQASAVQADAHNLPDWIAEADLVIDCTDQFETRQLINRLCHRLGRRLVMASVIQWSGQLLLLDPLDPTAGCYACLFDPTTQQADAACGAFGVFSTAAGLVGLMQAHEALKWLAGLPVQTGLLRLVDSRSLEIQAVRVLRHSGCPVCAGRPAGL